MRPSRTWLKDRSLPIAASLGLSLFSLCACSTKAGAPAKVYAFHGTVNSVDARDKAANIKGDAVKGWMEAMTMDYPVPDENDLKQLKPGLEFKADLVVTGDDYALRHVAPVNAAQK
jgi:Cu/Ag efflux protein CusF